MSQFIKKENLTIVIGEYEKNGQTKKEYRTIGEIVTMQGDDGSQYQFGRTWGPNGVMEFKVYPERTQQAQQQGLQQAQQQMQPHHPSGGYNQGPGF